MKVGIITFHFVSNYGAVLQAYALSKALADMGHDAQIIDYRPRPRPIPSWRERGQARKRPLVYRALRMIALRCRNVVPGIIRSMTVDPVFEAFRREQLPLTPDRYRSHRWFQTRPLDFDAYICGSDQVWNPYCRGFDPAYFLHFVPDGSARLIAYAPSFGGQFEIGSVFDDRIAGYIRRFDHLSVREAEGRDIIRQLTGRSAVEVVDPVLLLDDYSSISRAPNREDDYIAVYMLGCSPERTALVREAKAHFGLQAISLGPGSVPNVDQVRGTASVQEWLGYLSNARFVCTDSFHGTALSILFGRDFLTVPHPTRNERIACLLGRMHLLHRQATSTEASHLREQFRNPIPYDEVERRLGRFRRSSLDYLEHALVEARA